MTHTGTAQVRKPSSDATERELPIAPPSVPWRSRTDDGVVAHLRLLFHNFRLLFRIAVFGLVVGTLIAFLIPVKYESTARLMPPDNQSGSGQLAIAAAMSGIAGGLSGLASDFLNLKSTSDVFAGILNSRTVQDKLIQQFDLRKIYRDRRMEDTRKDLANRTSVSIDRKSQIITITVTDRSPQRAAAMSQAYVEELNKLVAELSMSSARRERIFLEGRLESVNQDLEAAEKEFSQFSSKNVAIDVKEQGKAMVEAAATLQGQLIAAQSEYESLRQIYTDNNVRVKAVKARIEELKRQLNKLGGKDESEIGQSGSSAQGSDDSLYPSIRKLPLLGVTYADLYRKIKIQEAVLETLTKEYEMAKVQEAKEIPTVKVLDAAYVPDKRSFPPRLVIVLLATLLASCLGVIFIFGEANWNAANPDDPHKQLALEVWSEIRSRAPWLTKNGAEPQATHRMLESDDGHNDHSLEF